MAWKFPPEEIIARLEDAGYDVAVYDNIEAVKDTGGENHQVYVNQDGRIRYQYSALNDSSSSSVPVDGKIFELDRENRDIFNLTGYIDSPGFVINLLEKAPEIIRKEGVK
ncbi:MAG: hypothetical protein M1269_12755 [Chloroflexi bacterium]|nr:hypothetical protein [Chloroflexota bacterium]